MYKRSIFNELLKRINGKRSFIQVLNGPRQTGKTTLAHQLMENINFPSHYATADEPALKDRIWIEQQWETARLKSPVKGKNRKVLLVLDEIQKIPGWSETVKFLWDEDTRNNIPMQVILLGSSALLVQKGLTESLAGRFEIIPITHWTFSEMNEAFGWSLEQYIFYGGYPGAVDLIKNHQRWVYYILNSLIETTVSRDILLMNRIDKPALLRRLFKLGCEYSGQILSYNKMLGQLQEAGNTTTLAHYLDLLEAGGLLTGLQKYAGQKVRRRGSSPKLVALNTALITAQAGYTFKEAKNNTSYWGRLVESAVGAHLFNAIMGTQINLYYWSSGNKEVDFVLEKVKDLVAIEVKSGKHSQKAPGLDVFSKNFKVKSNILVGEHGIPLEEFLMISPAEIF